MSEHTPLWSEERLGTRFKEILQHDILNRPLGTMRSDGQLHVQLMREVRDDYEAKLTELATLRARNEELEARIVVGESQLASCIAERDELWTGYCAAQTRAAELGAQLAAAWEPVPDDVREAMNLLLISVEYFAEHGDFYKYGHMSQPSSIVRQWFDALPPA
jgi:hypothetical protein